MHEILTKHDGLRELTRQLDDVRAEHASAVREQRRVADERDQLLLAGGGAETTATRLDELAGVVRRCNDRESALLAAINGWKRDHHAEVEAELIGRERELLAEIRDEIVQRLAVIGAELQELGFAMVDIDRVARPGAPARALTSPLTAGEVLEFAVRRVSYLTSAQSTVGWPAGPRVRIG